MKEFLETLNTIPVANPCNGLGTLYLNWLGDPQKAEESFQMAVDRAPKRAFRRAMLARAVAARGEPERALGLVDQAIQMVDDLPVCHAIRGDIQLRLISTM